MVKCSVHDSLHAEPAFEEDEIELQTSYAGNNDYGDSAYELGPVVDASYRDEEEENREATEDSTGGTLTWRSPCSMFLKLKSMLKLGRQPIPVAQNEL